LALLRGVAAPTNAQPDAARTFMTKYAVGRDGD